MFNSIGGARGYPGRMVSQPVVNLHAVPDMIAEPVFYGKCLEIGDRFNGWNQAVAAQDALVEVVVTTVQVINFYVF